MIAADVLESGAARHRRRNAPTSTAGSATAIEARPRPSPQMTLAPCRRSSRLASPAASSQHLAQTDTCSALRADVPRRATNSTRAATPTCQLGCRSSLRASSDSPATLHSGLLLAVSSADPIPHASPCRATSATAGCRTSTSWCSTGSSRRTSIACWSRRSARPTRRTSTSASSGTSAAWSGTGCASGARPRRCRSEHGGRLTGAVSQRCPLGYGHALALHGATPLVCCIITGASCPAAGHPTWPSPSACPTSWFTT
jgi:hypothetical protein